MSTSSPSSVRRLPQSASLSWDDCRLLVESVVDYAIFMLDIEGHVVTWNPGAERIKGYRAHEIVGEHFSKFYPPEDVASGKPERELELATKLGHIEDEGWRIRKDGSRFWASVIITALREDGGPLRGFGKVTRDLTVRKLAEEQLRQSEQRFHHLVDSVIDYAIFMLDEQGCVTSWNAGARRAKGYSADEILGQHFSKFYTAQDRSAGKPEAILAEVRRVGRCEDEGWRVRKDGTRFWANVILTSLRDDHGNVIGYAKVTRDLTERREAEANQRRLIQEQTARDVAESAERRIRESEERYRALSTRLEVVLEGVADGITVQEASGRFVFANSAAAQLWGFRSALELTQADSAAFAARFQLLNEEGEPVLSDALPAQRVLGGSESISTVLQIRERNFGGTSWVLARASAIAGNEGTPLAITIWHDITARRGIDRQAHYLAEASTALGTSLDWQEMLTGLAGVLVPALGDECSIYMLQHNRLELITTHALAPKLRNSEQPPPSFGPAPQQASDVWDVLRTGRCEVYSDSGQGLRNQSGVAHERWESLQAGGVKTLLLAPIRSRSQVLGVMVLTFAESHKRHDALDVALTEEIGRRTGAALENARLFEMARDAAKAAEAANRVKDEFLATVSHELRTPLSAILGWASILREKIKDPFAAKPLEVIHRNAEAQVKIIDDILDVSRVITGKFRLEPKPADLVDLARNALDVVRTSATARKIELTFQSEAGFLFLVADAERLQQVIWNLLSNAVKFTEPGGSVRLTLEHLGSNACITVSDTGRGIDPDFLPYVFERFKQGDSTTTRRVGGLGLGLALVRHIVELHGGGVAATSEGLGKGAQFTVMLPISTLMPPASAGSSSFPPHPIESLSTQQIQGVRVLTVDDDADARELIAEVLRGAGATVETARSAAEGFRAFARFRPDVLVSDIGMPDEDGYTFISRIRALSLDDGGRIPSLALTAFAREEDRTMALRAGYTTHIGKPISPGALVAAVANLSGVRPRS